MDDKREKKLRVPDDKNNLEGGEFLKKRERPQFKDEKATFVNKILKKTTLNESECLGIIAKVFGGK